MQLLNTDGALQRWTDVLEACLDLADASSLTDLERRLDRWFARLYAPIAWRVGWQTRPGGPTTLYLESPRQAPQSGADHTVALPLRFGNATQGELTLQFASDQIADAQQLRELGQLTGTLAKNLARIYQELLSAPQGAELFFAHAIMEGAASTNANPDLDNLARRAQHHLEVSVCHLIIDPLSVGGFRWGASGWRNTTPLSVAERRNVVQLATSVLQQTQHEPSPHLIVRGQQLQTLLHEYDLAGLASLRSLLLVPIVRDGIVIGAVIAGEERDWQRQPLPQQSVNMCRLLAETLVNALTHSYLVREVTARSHFLETCINGLSEAVIVTRSQVIALWNQAATELFGYRSDEVCGRHITDVLPNAPVDVVQSIGASSGRVGTVTFDWRMPTTGGREIELTCAVTRLDTHEADSIVLYAVQKSSYESEFAYLKDELLSVISHELRSPLNGIYGFGRLIMERPHMPESMRREALESLQASIERLIRLTNDITDAARAQRHLLPMEMDDIDIRAVVRSAVREMKLRHPGRAIRVRMARGLPPVYGDGLRIKQILDNLVNNAAKYSEPGAPINVSVRRDGEMVALSVTDRGPGIPKDAQRRIFESFYRGEHARTRRVSGVGLGLSIVKSLVEAHHGSVRIRSAIGKGSTFTFTLPLAKPGSPAIRAAA
jgi:PAS domain S-box-containing protein